MKEEIISQLNSKRLATEAEQILEDHRQRLAARRQAIERDLAALDHEEKEALADLDRQLEVAREHVEEAGKIFGEAGGELRQAKDAIQNATVAFRRRREALMKDLASDPPLDLDAAVDRHLNLRGA